MAAKEETPLMKQYNGIKAKHPDALLLFRVGDFYETFNEDAVKASKVLGIVLTKRSNGAASEMDLAGFPHHSLETYLPKLVRAGLRVAICDQLEDPKMTKTIVKRGVTEVVTPGTAFSDKILDHKSNNFLAAVYFQSENLIGLSILDVSTGEYFAAEGYWEYIDKLIQSFSPTEVLVSRKDQQALKDRLGNKFYIYTLDEWVFQQPYTEELLLKQLNTTSLKGFGIQDLIAATIAAGAALHYVQQTQQVSLSHIKSIARIDEDQFVWLDRFTIRNLEIISSPHEKATTLLDVMDHTVSPMGARLLRRWLLMPLKNIHAINERHEVVSSFFEQEEFSLRIEQILKSIGDLERLSSRIAIKKLTPREAVQLKRGVALLSPLKNELASSNNKALQKMGDLINPCAQLFKMLDESISDEAPAVAAKGGFIKDGYSSELDALRKISSEGKDYLLKIQREESERTGITSLKVAYNNVFGYYIEVTNAHKSKVPEGWIRKQTLTNAERYITEELKVYEETILGAEGKILDIEIKLYDEILNSTMSYIQALQQNAYQIAQADCLRSFAEGAKINNYVRPSLNEGLVINIKEGRHPVLEKQLPLGESYIPNDVFLDNESQQIIMITGPNMSGKSAILRQTALIVLMAQVGAYVPATSAEIGWVDKIFTRVGASDNLSQGESTFMVEMNETASILHNITNRSLVLLDEIGRGTSTYDGISIAWAIAEYLHQHPKFNPKTLFATHYHELNDMASQFKRVKNYNVSIKEMGNTILFLRKLVPGGSEHSFGIHVARMAGMPIQVLNKAEEVLKKLEFNHDLKNDGKSSAISTESGEMQLSIFQLDDPLLMQIRDEIVDTDINSLTPVEALIKLNEIKKLISKEKVK
jgi:DNA mismatch repair protein MutS